MTATAAASLETACRVRLGDSRLFKTALDRYIDENKPDPLVRKQMQRWKFEWHDNNDEEVGDVTAAFSFEPTHMISGRLQWKGEYINLPLDVLVYWKGDKEGSLFFSCSIPSGATEFLPAPASIDEKRDKDDNGEKQQLSKKEIRAANRVHQRMIQRLKSDDYIQLLLMKSSKTGSENKKSNQHQQEHSLHSIDLCEATIDFSEQNLAERVHCNDKTAEAVRRAVFSSADSSLDVFDFILSLPFLPTKTHSTIAGATDASSSSYLGSEQTTGLADRAKLRLLEDAMYDACEREEEDELMQDLQISKKAKTKSS